MFPDRITMSHTAAPPFTDTYSAATFPVNAVRIKRFPDGQEATGRVTRTAAKSPGPNPSGTRHRNVPLDTVMQSSGIAPHNDDVTPPPGSTPNASQPRPCTAASLPDRSSNVVGLGVTDGTIGTDTDDRAYAYGRHLASSA